MATHALDIGPLRRAVDRLDEGLRRYQTDIDDVQIRDGLVQRFEFTYEASHKMLRRYLVMRAASPGEFDHAAFADLIRAGADQDLLRDGWPAWRRYREMRGKTSHAYDDDIALEVVAGIPEFLDEARFLLDRLDSRGHG
ncbi:MAG TPA: HI0074 family nucleotidyltransferase substrate-binding subunit [Nevskiaceae bacterium]|nr:HI0074 family nucleotidyltransferase substrate-binding subunit [Nevskiaceae bacterium]